MATPSSAVVTALPQKHPRGLYVLFATEMWERFSFYTMLSLLVLYMKNPEQGFGWSTAQAAGVYANYLMFVYASPIIGGWLADRVTGYRTAITLGGLFMAAGHVLLAFPSEPALYAALTCLVIGNGFFKPNISTMVGNLYPEGSHLKDSAFNIFYMGINLGAFFSPIVAEIVMQNYGFHPAFATAGAGMFVSLFIFWGFKRYIIGSDRAHRAQTATGRAEEASVTEDVPPQSAQHQVRALEKKQAIDLIPDYQRIVALCVIFSLVIVFWMVFHQNGSTLTVWADENTDWTLAPSLLYLAHWLTLGTTSVDTGNVSGVISNAINPFWIVVLTFPLVAFWGWLDKRGKEPSTVTKMAFGMLLTAASFYVLYFAAQAGGDTGRVSPWWLIASYGVISLGELMLSPMGLALVSKVAPQRMRGMMMGGWFLSTAIGNKLTAIGVYWDVWSHSRFFFLLASMALAMFCVLMLLRGRLKAWMPGV